MFKLGGGQGYTGDTVCEANSTCVYQDATFSICLPASSTSPSPAPNPNSPIPPSGLPVGAICNDISGNYFAPCVVGSSCRYIDDYTSKCVAEIPEGEQCGGDGYTGLTQCGLAHKCVKVAGRSDNYAICTLVVPFAQSEEQCGGAGFTGFTDCYPGSGLACTYVNETYSSCQALDFPLGGPCGGSVYTTELLNQIFPGNSGKCEVYGECIAQNEYFSGCYPKSLPPGGKCSGLNYYTYFQCPPNTKCTYQDESTNLCLPPNVPSPSPVVTALPSYTTVPLVPIPSPATIVIQSSPLPASPNGASPSSSLVSPSPMASPPKSASPSVSPSPKAKTTTTTMKTTKTTTTSKKKSPSKMIITLSLQFYKPLIDFFSKKHRRVLRDSDNVVVMDLQERHVALEDQNAIELTDISLNAFNRNAKQNYEIFLVNYTSVLCGGQFYTGDTVCEENTVCVVQDSSFSICLPASNVNASPTPKSNAPPAPPSYLPLGTVCYDEHVNPLGTCVPGSSCRYIDDITAKCVAEVPEGGQCGGDGYTGVTQCTAAHQCLKVPGRSDGYAVCTYVLPFVELGGQCGGTGYTGLTDCYPGSGLSCTFVNETYSACQKTDIPLGGPCGGSAYPPELLSQIFPGSTGCESWAECVSQNEYISVCLPKYLPEGAQCSGLNYFTWYQCVTNTKCTYQNATTNLCLPAKSPSPVFTIPSSTWTGTQIIPIPTPSTTQTVPSPIPVSSVSSVSPAASPSPKPNTTTTTTPVKTTKTTTTKKGSPTPTCVKKWDQCGGHGYTGPKCCVKGECHRINSYFSQCF
ncbi:hypothetical protein HK098_003091 [Nowakowskiella sp. JEL0407]|nr:hypothetical protein HK098_003091 [Nowakowskiella sp. JEL0407]